MYHTAVPMVLNTMYHQALVAFYLVARHHMYQQEVKYSRTSTTPQYHWTSVPHYHMVVKHHVYQQVKWFRTSTTRLYASDHSAMLNQHIRWNCAKQDHHKIALCRVSQDHCNIFYHSVPCTIPSVPCYTVKPAPDHCTMLSEKGLNSCVPLIKAGAIVIIGRWREP